MLENLEKYQIVLASSSPRRKELLQRLGLPFKVRTLLGIDETYPSDLPAEKIAEYVSQKKAEGYKKTLLDNELIITADTIVCMGDQVYGKPHDVEEAKTMLHELSGHRHKVFSGVTVFIKDKMVSFTVESRVTFAVLDQEEIDYYVENYLPLDKAGAYGIQDWIGVVAIESIEGSYFNVVGLPMQRLYNILKKF